MRKMKFLFAACMLSVAMLVGCGDKDSKVDSSITPEELLENIKDADTDIKSLEFEIGGDINATNAGTELALDAKINGKADIEKNLYNFTAEANMDGTSVTVDCYIAVDDTKVGLYAQFNGTWIKYEADVAELADEYLDNVDLGAATDAASEVKVEEILKLLKDTKVDVSDDTYTLSGKLNMEKIFEEAGDEAEQYSYLKDLDATLSVKVNNDYSLNKVEIKIGKVVIPGEDGDVTLNSVTLYASADKYNEAMDIKIPDEALNGMDAEELLQSMFGGNDALTVPQE